MKKTVIAILVSAAVICGCGQNRGTGRNRDKAQEALDSLELKYNPTVEKGSAAPDFSLRDTLGTCHSLSELKGNYVVLDFWASWCGDCRREIPAMKSLYEKWNSRTIGGKGICFLSVSFDHDAEAWKSVLKDEGFAWPQVSNLIKWKGNPVASDYGLHWIPSYVIVDPDGKVADYGITVKRVDTILESLH